MTTRSKIITKRFFSCPACGEGEHRFDHLEEGVRDADRGPFKWHCDECHVDFKFYMGRDLKPCRFEVLDKKPHREKLVLLRLREPMRDGTTPFIVISATDYGHGEPGDPFGPDQYYYDEHTCPTNWMGVEALIESRHNGYVDCDPHGLFVWVRSMFTPEGFDHLKDEWAAVFPEIEGHQVIEGAVLPPRLLA